MTDEQPIDFQVIITKYEDGSVGLENHGELKPQTIHDVYAALQQVLRDLDAQHIASLFHATMVQIAQATSQKQSKVVVPPPGIDIENLRN